VSEFKPVQIDLSELPIETIDDVYFALNALQQACQIARDYYPNENILPVWVVGYE
jgi:hypothetical protein